MIIRLVELLVILVPLAGAVWASMRAWRRRQGAADEVEPGYDYEDQDVRAVPRVPAGQDQAGRWRTITRVVEQHAMTDNRWLDYELDAAKLLDFPVMTDMGHPLVMQFHKAKLRADLLRPLRAEDLLDDREAAGDYLAAVEDYVTAFNAAEAEAVRRRRGEFSRDAQQRIARAQSLLRVAGDPTATAPERTQAYELASKELDGLVLLPEPTRIALERGIAGELGG